MIFGGPTDGDAKVAIPLAQLEQGMMLVESVHIEQIEADGSTPNNIEDLQHVDVPDNNIAVVVMDESVKPKLDIDKNALFSQMKDKFAKDKIHRIKKHWKFSRFKRQIKLWKKVWQPCQKDNYLSRISSMN